MIELCLSAINRRRRSGARHRAAGFTLIELVVTMVVAVVLTAIAVPSFKRITLSNKLTTTANDLVGAIQTARMEAIKRNADTQLCGNASNGSDALGTACATQTGAVYALSNGTAVPVLDGTNLIAAPLALTGDMTPLRFGGDGLAHTLTDTSPYSGLVADISTDSMSSDNHRCIRISAGSVVSTTTASNACPP